MAATGGRRPSIFTAGAQAAEPYNRVVEYRLSRAVRHNGETAEAEQIEQRVRRRDLAIQEIRPLYDEATETPGLGTRHHTELYQRIADVRERMQLPEEARAWHDWSWRTTATTK